MKCFYHEDREAVGQCLSCGKGLCKECIVANQGTCVDCVLKNSQAYAQEKREQIENESLYLYDALINYKKTIFWAIVKSIIFAIILEFFGLMYLYGYKQQTTIADKKSIIILLLLFGIPFGYSAWTNVFGRNPNSADEATLEWMAAGSGNENVAAFGNARLFIRFIGFLLKLTCCVFIGLPSILYLIIQHIKTKRQIKNLSKAYSDSMKEFDELDKNIQNEINEQNEINVQSVASSQPVQPAEPTVTPQPETTTQIPVTPVVNETTQPTVPQQQNVTNQPVVNTQPTGNDQNNINNQNQQ